MDARRFDKDPMTVEEFLDWHQYQEERYELVQGIPVRMMTGARQDHNLAITNLVVSLDGRARPRGCRTTSSDTAVRTVADQVRYPDVVLDCGPMDPTFLAASEPKLVVEVASPSTRDFDLADKLDEYRRTPGLDYVLMVEPAVIDVTLHARTADGWTITKHLFLDAVVEMPGIGVSLPLTEIYEGLSPEPRTPLQPAR